MKAQEKFERSFNMAIRDDFENDHIVDDNRLKLIIRALTDMYVNLGIDKIDIFEDYNENHYLESGRGYYQFLINECRRDRS